MIPPQILTATGRYFDFATPDPASIEIDDIAIALSRICRFTGHTREFYSVAQHSVYVSYNVPREHALAGLLHDAAEAYIGDCSTPLKRMLPDYKTIERRVEFAICERFGLCFPLHPCVKQADLRMLLTERRDLMPQPLPENVKTDAIAWSDFDGIPPLTTRIRGLHSEDARQVFLDRFYELTR
ncbi:hypothetical protein R6138_04581 [Ralstonia thomasii]|uniref:metal-dependent phosphohydrolase n=1 Tax=Ralstonia thomasii TaxID=3058596 RepID=UPI0028F5D652|nr:metal-dependent phosphohydrolase [Ralstonia sp. LMG 18095]CAJ0901439.1 hypothetical protein R6138_04581 [Ralstonia sp. LMG 18095]